jgi:hypothetical protein
MMAQYSAYWSQLGGHNPMMMMDMMQHQQQHMWQTGNYSTAPPILPANAAAPAAAEAPPPVLPAAADEHAADDGDDAIARDFLDYAYLALRASMLLIVLYYYSSSVRIFGRCKRAPPSTYLCVYRRACRCVRHVDDATSGRQRAGWRASSRASGRAGKQPRSE